MIFVMFFMMFFVMIFVSLLNHHPGFAYISSVARFPFLSRRDGGQHPVLGDCNSGGGEFRLCVFSEKRRSEAHPAAADLLREMPRDQAQLHSGQRSGAQFNTAVKFGQS